MAALCPCGCGKKLSLLERGGGKQVRALNERIEFLADIALPFQRNAGVDSEELQRFEEFIDDGRTFRDQMLGVIHGDLDARAVDRRLMNAWGMTAAKIKGNTIGTLYRVTPA